MESLNYSLLRDFDYLLKFILIGDAAVGKSAMLLKYADDMFEESYICTIGVDFKMKSLQVNGKKVKLQIWDTAGQERFKPITNCYFRGSHGCIVVFDICNRDSFKKLSAWVKDYKEQNEEFKNNILLIGNKIDKKKERQVRKKEALALAKQFNCEYIETSAKTGHNLSDVFEELTRLVLDNLKGERLSNSQSTIDISESAKKHRACCLSL